MESFEDDFEGNPRVANEFNHRDANGLEFPLRGVDDADERRTEENFPHIDMMADRSTPLVRLAMPLDAKELKALADSVSISRMNLTTAHDSGFLVSNYTQRDYSNFVKNVEHFLTIHVGRELVGFLLAYGSEQITDRQREQEEPFVLPQREEPFVLIEQICVSPKAEHRRKGYASLLYKEMYARILHYYDPNPRPIYLAIVNEPANPVSIAFHESMGFEFQEPQINMPRSIFLRDNLAESLDSITTEETKSEACPFYDARASMDPHCVGIGITMYSISPPDGHGLFDANIRVVMKWRQPGIQNIYPRVDDGEARTNIAIEAHTADRTELRFPRYDLNKEDCSQEQYAYIDKSDPHDVITWQQVLRGKFMGIVDNLTLFPADKQELRFAFRMWDNDPDDRCRYFRQLHYADNTPWQLGIKRHVKSLSFSFLAPEVYIDVFEVSQTSRYILKIHVLREATYYLRTVAFPMILITSLSFASIPIDGFGDEVGFNSSLLLTTVAYLFITKDVTPATSEVTILDVITYGALLLSWGLIMLHFIASHSWVGIDEETEQIIGFVICSTTVGVQSFLFLFVYFRYKAILKESSLLGDL